MYVPLKKPNILLCLCSIGIIRQNMDNQTSTWSPVLFSGGPEIIFPRGNILHLTHVIKIAIPLLLFFCPGEMLLVFFSFSPLCLAGTALSVQFWALEALRGAAPHNQPHAQHSGEWPGPLSPPHGRCCLVLNVPFPPGFPSSHLSCGLGLCVPS